MYKKILFDLDNTLVDDNENRKYAIRRILLERNETAIGEKAEEFVKFDDQFWKDRAARKIKDPYEFKSKEEKTEWIRAERFIRYFGDITFEESVNINHKYLNYLKEYIIPIKSIKYEYVLCTKAK